MDLTHWLLSFAALINLYLATILIDRMRRLSAQVAVLTLREAELAETVEALDVILRTERHRGKP